MPITPTYPGVYIEEIPSGVRTIVGVSTSVAAFIGYTARGPINGAVQVFGFGEYERRFGGLHKDSPVSYAVQHFFLNGGSEAWIVRVADSASRASVRLKSGIAGPDPAVLEITARSEGAWGNNLRVEVDYDTANVDSLFNLTVTELVDQGGTLVPGRVEKHRNLSMSRFFGESVEGAVNASSELIQVSRLQDPAGQTTATSGVIAAADLGQLGDDHRRLALSLHGAAPVEFDFLPAGPPPPLPDLPTLAGILQTALNTAFGAGSVAVTSINGDTQLQFTATPPVGQADRGRIRFGNATARNAAAILKLGLGNGGREVDTAAAIRPTESGTKATTVPNVPGLPAPLTIDVTIVAPPLANDVVTGVTLWTAGNAPTSLEQVRERLQSALTSSSKEALNRARASLVDSRLQVIAGGANSNARLQFTGAVALGLTGAGVEDNVAQYALGSAGQTSQAQQAGTAGADGTIPSVPALVGNRPSKTGIYALENVDIFNILCLPDQSDVSLLSEALAYAAERRAFAILDFPAFVDSVPEARQWVNSNATLRHKNAALYFPRIQLADPLDNGQLRAFPSCGAVAGIYARTDASRGVWKAPAGTEARLLGVQKVDYTLTDPETGVLNPLGINCIRLLPVYGPVVWGARTLDGADALASEWKYIPVRRFALFLEESLYRGTKWVVFEPNDEPLWAQIRLNIGAFLQNLFRQGAFQGRTPREAYFVKCDRETTTQTDINLGIVNILVGFAPLKPAEFVIIKIQQMAGQIPT